MRLSGNLTSIDFTESLPPGTGIALEFHALETAGEDQPGCRLVHFTGVEGVLQHTHAVVLLPLCGSKLGAVGLTVLQNSRLQVIPGVRAQLVEIAHGQVVVL